MRFLIPALLVFSLLGCGKPIPLAQPPCDDPVPRPTHSLTGLEAAKQWNRDREALRICKLRNEAASGR
jgi:predicted small lipoprotein YifL